MPWSKFVTGTSRLPLSSSRSVLRAYVCVSASPSAPSLPVKLRFSIRANGCWAAAGFAPPFEVVRAGNEKLNEETFVRLLGRTFGRATHAPTAEELETHLNSSNQGAHRLYRSP